MHGREEEEMRDNPRKRWLVRSEVGYVCHPSSPLASCVRAGHKGQRM